MAPATQLESEYGSLGRQDQDQHQKIRFYQSAQAQVHQKKVPGANVGGVSEENGKVNLEEDDLHLKNCSLTKGLDFFYSFF